MKECARYCFFFFAAGRAVRGLFAAIACRLRVFAIDASHITVAWREIRQTRHHVYPPTVVARRRRHAFDTSRGHVTPMSVADTRC